MANVFIRLFAISLVFFGVSSWASSQVVAPVRILVGAPAIQDGLAGQVELMFAAVGNAQAQIKAGKLKALGMTIAKRLAAFPDVPTIGEVLRGFESSAWFGLFAPARMDAPLAKKLSDGAREAIATADVRWRLETEGYVPVGNAPDEFGKFVQTEITRWARVVKFSGAKPE